MVGLAVVAMAGIGCDSGSVHATGGDDGAIGSKADGGSVGGDGASSGVCPHCQHSQVGTGSGQGFDPAGNDSDSVGVDSDGALVIDKNTALGYGKNFLWVADTNLPGVVKIDLDTMKLVARYRTGGASTSRTTVNVLGEAFVGGPRQRQQRQVRCDQGPALRSRMPRHQQRRQDHHLDRTGRRAALRSGRLRRLAYRDRGRHPRPGGRRLPRHQHQGRLRRLQRSIQGGVRQGGRQQGLAALPLDRWPPRQDLPPRRKDRPDPDDDRRALPRLRHGAFGRRSAVDSPRTSPSSTPANARTRRPATPPPPAA